MPQRNSLVNDSSNGFNDSINNRVSNPSNPSEEVFGKTDLFKNGSPNQESPDKDQVSGHFYNANSPEKGKAPNSGGSSN